MRRRAFLAGTGAVALAAAPARAEGDGATAFEQVWRTVRDRFYDPRLAGLDWDAVGRRYRDAAASAPGREARAVVVNRMLGELRASHTRLYTPEETDYYDLSDLFARQLQGQGLARVFPGGEVRYASIGVLTMTDAAGRSFAVGVIPGGAASLAGLLAGDELVAADGAPFRSVDSFRGRAGTTVTLAIRRRAADATVTLPVVPETVKPSAAFLSGLEGSARLIPAANGARIGYVRVWSYAGWRYQAAIERLVSAGRLAGADALVMDLRDGWGGAQPDYLDLFDRHGLSMELIGRDGRSRFEAVRWRKPAAMLVNAGTRSGKEVLADGFARYGLGPVIGTRTEGAVLAATAFLMSDDTLLLLAVEDVRIDGRRLEGIGVRPTIEVPFDIRYAAGADPQLDRAVQTLAAAAHTEGRKP